MRVRRALLQFILPCFHSDVASLVEGSLGVQVDGCVEGVALFEWAAGQSALMGAGADVPVLLHGWEKRTEEMG